MGSTTSKSDDSDARIWTHSPGCVMYEVETIGIQLALTPAEALALQVRKTVVSTDAGAVDVVTDEVTTSLCEVPTSVLV